MPTSATRALVRSFRLALRPVAAPPAVAAATRALVASGVIAEVGALVGDLQVTGVAYFGVACAASFATGVAHHTRMLALTFQGLGAAAGIASGSLLPHSAVAIVVAAAVAGVVSGLVGGMSPSAPAFGVMLSIGVAFGQFGGSTLSWWQQCLWYLAGTAMVGAIAMLPWLFRRGASERRIVADVFARAADLCEAIGTADARPARLRLAAASAAARSVPHPPAADLTAFAVAGFYGENRRVAPTEISAIRTAGWQTLRGDPVDVPMTARDDPQSQAIADALSRVPTRPPAPPPRRIAAALRTLGTRTALANATRIGLCLGVATATAVILHRPGDHALWLPLTTAVVVRPEYASVFVRATNRITGTILGAVLAAVLLWLAHSGVMIAAGAALALAAAVLTAPQLYAFYVAGVTTSTLLAASLGRTELALPIIRVTDTLLGAAIGVFFGYLLWPGARRLPGIARLDSAIRATSRYLDEATHAPDHRTRWQSRRDDAYRLAHQVRTAAEVAITEPPPVSAVALRLVPLASQLEDVVDTVTALAANVDAGRDVAADAERIRDALTHLRAETKSVSDSGRCRAD